MPSGLISISSIDSGAVRISAASFEKGSADSPWKERVQSWDVSAPSSRFRGPSERPVLRFGVGFEAAEVVAVEVEEGVEVAGDVACARRGAEVYIARY